MSSIIRLPFENSLNFRCIIGRGRDPTQDLDGCGYYFVDQSLHSRGLPNDGCVDSSRGRFQFPWENRDGDNGFEVPLAGTIVEFNRPPVLSELIVVATTGGNGSGNPIQVEVLTAEGRTTLHDLLVPDWYGSSPDPAVTPLIRATRAGIYQQVGEELFTLWQCSIPLAPGTQVSAVTLRRVGGAGRTTCFGLFGVGREGSPEPQCGIEGEIWAAPLAAQMDLRVVAGAGRSYSQGMDRQMAVFQDRSLAPTGLPVDGRVADPNGRGTFCFAWGRPGQPNAFHLDNSPPVEVDLSAAPGRLSLVHIVATTGGNVEGIPLQVTLRTDRGDHEENVTIPDWFSPASCEGPVSVLVRASRAPYINASATDPLGQFCLYDAAIPVPEGATVRSVELRRYGLGVLTCFGIFGTVGGAPRQEQPGQREEPDGGRVWRVPIAGVANATGVLNANRWVTDDADGCGYHFVDTSIHPEGLPADGCIPDPRGRGTFRFPWGDTPAGSHNSIRLAPMAPVRLALDGPRTLAEVHVVATTGGNHSGQPLRIRVQMEDGTSHVTDGLIPGGGRWAWLGAAHPAPPVVITRWRTDWGNVPSCSAPVAQLATGTRATLGNPGAPDGAQWLLFDASLPVPTDRRVAAIELTRLGEGGVLTVFGVFGITEGPAPPPAATDGGRVWRVPIEGVANTTAVMAANRTVTDDADGCGYHFVDTSIHPAGVLLPLGRHLGRHNAIRLVPTYPVRIALDGPAAWPRCTSSPPRGQPLRIRVQMEDGTSHVTDGLIPDWGNVPRCSAPVAPLATGTRATLSNPGAPDGAQWLLFDASLPVPTDRRVAAIELTRPIGGGVLTVFGVFGITPDNNENCGQTPSAPPAPARAVELDGRVWRVPMGPLDRVGVVSSTRTAAGGEGCTFCDGTVHAAGHFWFLWATDPWPVVLASRRLPVRWGLADGPAAISELHLASPVASPTVRMLSPTLHSTPLHPLPPHPRPAVGCLPSIGSVPRGPRREVPGALGPGDRLHRVHPSTSQLHIPGPHSAPPPLAPRALPSCLCR
ncbi:hypothetical protein PAPYR_1154 [Paratrimastix pyriformis]|uniref:Uncharacterized protein n=1 Tax=Paratrimastix pyriformis TaxID=342808 RepID=A0ABQ8US92_9EUKA|nr:hypothetical protein PAPYR_1154 [Paratrimastix pyriformis]